MEDEQIINEEVIGTVEELKNPRKKVAGKELKIRDAKARSSSEIKKSEGAIATQASEVPITQDETSTSTIFDDLIKLGAIIGAGFSIFHAYNFMNADGSNPQNRHSRSRVESAAGAAGAARRVDSVERILETHPTRLDVSRRHNNNF